MWLAITAAGKFPRQAVSRSGFQIELKSRLGNIFLRLHCPRVRFASDLIKPFEHSGPLIRDDYCSRLCLVWSYLREEVHNRALMPRVVPRQNVCVRFAVSVLDLELNIVQVFDG